MSKSKVTSLVIGTTLLGVGLVAGVVVNTGESAISVQAASKTFTQNVTMPATVNKKVKRVLFKKLTAPIPNKMIGQSYIYAATPKLAGYKAKPKVLISLYGNNNQYQWALTDILNYYKVQKKYTGKKITVHGAIQATKNGKQYAFKARKVTAPNWSIVKVAAPKIKGYKANVKTVQLGVIRWSNSLTDNPGGFDTLTNLRYTKIK
ncbi:hypothetical protein [Lactiplantibacillus daowaiensis]|uniref:Extracellular protein n=1 Tax=Lactiplantibacillus daowaiensis TaxID=2559918 RepID=A0ABW1RZC1_9LACO|nr:hypothetical protein [Lactiplantibacillus daowaiensis]